MIHLLVLEQGLKLRPSLDCSPCPDAMSFMPASLKWLVFAVLWYRPNIHSSLITILGRALAVYSGVGGFQLTRVCVFFYYYYFYYVFMLFWYSIMFLTFWHQKNIQLIKSFFLLLLFFLLRKIKQHTCTLTLS